MIGWFYYKYQNLIRVNEESMLRVPLPFPYLKKLKKELAPKILTPNLSVAIPIKNYCDYIRDSICLWREKKTNGLTQDIDRELFLLRNTQGRIIPHYLQIFFKDFLESQISYEKITLQDQINTKRGLELQQVLALVIAMNFSGCKYDSPEKDLAQGGIVEFPWLMMGPGISKLSSYRGNPKRKIVVSPLTADTMEVRSECIFPNLKITYSYHVNIQLNHLIIEESTAACFLEYDTGMQTAVNLDEKAIHHTLLSLIPFLGNKSLHSPFFHALQNLDEIQQDDVIKTILEFFPTFLNPLHTFINGFRQRYAIKDEWRLIDRLRAEDTISAEDKKAIFERLEADLPLLSRLENTFLKLFNKLKEPDPPERDYKFELYQKILTSYPEKALPFKSYAVSKRTVLSALDSKITQDPIGTYYQLPSDILASYSRETEDEKKLIEQELRIFYPRQYILLQRETFKKEHPFLGTLVYLLRKPWNFLGKGILLIDYACRGDAPREELSSPGVPTLAIQQRLATNARGEERKDMPSERARIVKTPQVSQPAKRLKQPLPKSLSLSSQQRRILPSRGKTGCGFRPHLG